MLSHGYLDLLDEGSVRPGLKPGCAFFALQCTQVISHGLAKDSASFLWQRQQRGWRSTTGAMLVPVPIRLHLH